MDPRRRFNGRERAALFLAADGRCAECRAELAPSWKGCTCHSFDPTPERAQEAIRRLAIETVEMGQPREASPSVQSSPDLT